MGIVLYIFWPAIAAFIPGGLLAERRPRFASIFVASIFLAVLLGLATWQRLTSPLTTNRTSAVVVTWVEIAVGALLGWAIVRRIDKRPPT